jgi:hypothetical protein
MFMAIHPLLQTRQSPRLTDPEQLLHLVLQSDKSAITCPSNSVIPHLFFSYETGRSVNTALENREYTGGVDPSYIRT